MPSRTAIPEVETEYLDITPDIAEKFLSTNTHNRGLRNRRVLELAGAMARGEWKFNGDAIRFDYNGTLLDGQHRLWAVIESGVTIECLVIRNLPPDTQETMDTGGVRNLTDTLRLRGEKSANNLACIITTLWRRQTGQIRNPSARPSIAQALALLDKTEGLVEASRAANQLRSHFRVPTSVAGAVWYELGEVDADDRDVFWEKLETGIGLEKGSPLLQLRRYLEAQALNVHQRGSAIVTHAMFIKAWNLWREGRLVDRLSWRAVGLNAETFPEPTG